jgi:hypothetical protein
MQQLLGPVLGQQQTNKHTFDGAICLPVERRAGVPQHVEVSIVRHHLCCQAPRVFVEEVSIQQVLQQRGGALLAQAVGQQDGEAGRIALQK